MQNNHKAPQPRKSRRNRSPRAIWEIAMRKVRIRCELAAVRAKVAEEKRITPSEAA